MRKFGIGLVGAGTIGTYHAKGYSRVRQVYGGELVPEFVIVADLDEERAKTAADKFGFAQWTTDYKEVVNHPDVDVVLVCTPNYTHAEIAIAAANAGKHVMCEKPMAMTMKESQEMVDAIEKNGVKSFVNFTYTGIPMIRYTKQLVDQGDLGDILTFRGYFDCDYCLDPETPMTWRQYASQAGTGAIGDVTAHVIALSDMLVGSEIEEVMATSEIVFPERPAEDGSGKAVVDTDDQVYILVKYANGHIGQMSSSRIAAGRPADIGYDIQGTKGAARYTLTSMNDLELYLSGRPEGQEAGFQVVKSTASHGDYGLQTAYPVAGIGYADIFTTQAHRFLEAIDQDRESEINIAYAHHVDQVMFAIVKSAEERRWVKVSEITA